jgi:Uma2 family endonuclease
MSNVAILPPRDDGFARKKWSVKECRFLTESGLLTPGKYELIEGEIVFKRGQGRVHIAVVTQIVTALIAIFGADAIQNQAQIGIGEMDEFNDPEPDVAVLKGTVADYLEREPDPAAEVLLAVEAANTTLQGDTTTKARLYARHGLPEYWVVAIPSRTLSCIAGPRRKAMRMYRPLMRMPRSLPWPRRMPPYLSPTFCPVQNRSPHPPEGVSSPRRFC